MSRGLLFPLGVAGALAVGILIFLSFGQRAPVDAYEPRSQDGPTIFIEACAKCHGMKGEGSPLGPRLAGRSIPSGQVEIRVRGGSGGMPRFPHIRETALGNLAAYVGRL